MLNILYTQYYLTLLSPQPYESGAIDVTNLSIQLRLREGKKHVQVYTATSQWQSQGTELRQPDSKACPPNHSCGPCLPLLIVSKSHVQLLVLCLTK